MSADEHPGLHPDWVRDCLYWRGRILIGKFAHWCFDWDELPIDETCSNEWPCGCGIEKEIGS